MFTPDGQVDLQPVADRPLKLAKLLVIIRDSQHDGTWARLKACHNCECRWAYYDRSHAGRGAWCDMSVCGNRLKNRPFGREKPARRGGGHKRPESQTKWVTGELGHRRTSRYCAIRESCIEKTRPHSWIQMDRTDRNS